MKAISKVSVKGFYVILTEEKYRNGNICGNVRFNNFTKEMLKLKKAYTTDVECENYDGISVFHRKIVFPLLDINEIQSLFYNCDFTDRCNTMGSLTIEHGWLNARSYSANDDYHNQNTNAYVSVLFDFSGFENVKEESYCMLKNYEYQQKMENAIYDCLDNEDWDELEFLSKKEFIYDNLQLEIQF